MKAQHCRTKLSCQTPISRQIEREIRNRHITKSSFATNYMLFLYKQSKFGKQVGACLWEKLVQAQSMLALCLFSKILLGVCLRKRLDQARNMIILEKLLYKICCCCDTDYNVIGYLASSERHLFCCIFDESQGKCFAILNRKNHSQYGKIHATQENA